MAHKVLAIGDLHCKVSSIQRFQEACRAIIKVIRQEQPDTIILVGDIANDHERIHSACMHAISTFLEYLGKLQIPTYYIVGNHDMVNNTVFLDPKMNTIVPLAAGTGVTVVSKPMVAWSPALAAANLKLVLCPYVFPGRFQEALRTLAPEFNYESAHAIFCHQEFRGAKLGMLDSVVGDTWPVTWPLVVSGHIHDYDRLQQNIIYIGAPMQHGFAERLGKTISLLTFEDGRLQEEKRISLGLAEKSTLKTEAANFKELVEAHQATFGAETRLIVTGSSEELSKIKNSKLYKTLPMTVKVILKPADGPAKVADRSAAHGQSYQELLTAALKLESKAVNDIYTEIFSATEAQ